MRRSRGTIELSGVTDIPVLRAIWEAEAITSSQLVELLKFDGYKLPKSRSALPNRLRRLHHYGYIGQKRIHFCGVKTGYTIEPWGTTALVHSGQIQHYDPDQPTSLMTDSQCIQTNDLRIGLGKQRIPHQWLSAKERNGLYYRDHCKLPEDGLCACITVRGNWGCARIAVFLASAGEMSAECTKLQEKWVQARDLHWILCVTSSEEQARWLARQFRPSHIAICVTTHKKLSDEFLNAVVFQSGEHERVSLTAFLRSRSQPLLPFD